jgi:hypothetical protein
MAQTAASSAPVMIMEESTLEESVFKTIWRDVMTIGRNLRSVLIPINWKFSNRDQALRNWDLWGPLVRVLCKTACCKPWRHSRAWPMLGMMGMPLAGASQIFMLLLASVLSWGERDSSKVFAVSEA